MREDAVSKKETISAETRAFQAELDEHIARMREVLRLIAPGTGAMALGAMRRTFPDAPLAERVEALKTYR